MSFKYLQLAVFLLVVAPVLLLAQSPTLYGTPQAAFSATSSSGPSSLTLDLPSGGTALSAPAVYIVETGTRSGSPAFDVPSGFTQECSLSLDEYDTEQLFYKVYSAGDTPPASITVTDEGGWTWGAAAAVAYTGIRAAAPLDNGCTSTSESGNTTSIPGPSFTTTLNNDRVVWAFFAQGDVGTSSITPSMGTAEIAVPPCQCS